MRRSLLPRKQPESLRIGTRGIGQDKRVYRVEYANSAQRTKVWRLAKTKPSKATKLTKLTKPTKLTKRTKRTKQNKQNKQAKRQAKRGTLRGGRIVKPRLSPEAEQLVCRLQAYAESRAQTHNSDIHHVVFDIVLPLCTMINRYFTVPDEQHQQTGILTDHQIQTAVADLFSAISNARQDISTRLLQDSDNPDLEFELASYTRLNAQARSQLADALMFSLGE